MLRETLTLVKTIMIGPFVLLSLALTVSIVSAQSPLIVAKRKAPSGANHRSDPKCVFLNEEYRRVRKISEEMAVNARFSNAIKLIELPGIGATIDELADSIKTSEEIGTRMTILRLSRNSCELGESLSSLERLPTVEGERQRQLRRIMASWQTRGGEDESVHLKAIIDRINSIYDAEAKSFYNPESTRGDLDSDVGKDYPQLQLAIKESPLSNEQKTYLEQQSRYIRYDEAGRLFNILKGIDPNGTIGYAYTLRKSLAARVEQTERSARAEAAKNAAKEKKHREDMMTWLSMAGFLVAALVGGVFVFRNSRRYAQYRATRYGHLRMRYAFGTKELILWEPGEAVILLRNKKLTAMVDATGGYTTISAWKDEEYKGRITYKTQLMKYTSEAIQTSDGIAVRLELGIFWQIANPNHYVQRIAADFHEDGSHQGTPRAYSDDPRGEKYYDKKLTEAAQKWIQILAGSSLREHICRLSAAKLISPSIQAYIQEYYGPAQQASENSHHFMPATLESAQAALSSKLDEYGIRIEKLEVIKLNLPKALEDKLETVRLSFLQPAQAAAETEARNIDKRGLNQLQNDALRDLADIIGKDNVAKIEFLKAIGLAKIPFVAPSAPPFAALQSIFTSKPNSDPSFTEFPAELPEQSKPAE